MLHFVVLFILYSICQGFLVPYEFSTKPFRHFLDKRIVADGNCKLTPGERVDCGHFGIQRDECEKKGCCWKEEKLPDVPWCFYSAKELRPNCAMNAEERIECGYYGIQMNECEQKGCCWQPIDADGIPWCFHEKVSESEFSSSCGRPYISPKASSRIVGGREAVPHSWPWMVSIGAIDYNHFCGGSIIDKEWIVSAAHCYDSYMELNEYKVRVGLHDVDEKNEFSRTLDVTKIVVHENYSTVEDGYDIMLMKVSPPMIYNRAIKPVCLPEPEQEITSGKKCFATGWGHTQEGGYGPDKLQQVTLPVLDNEVCNKEDYYDGQITDTMVCAGYLQGGKDSCQGDSGGPFVCYDDDNRFDLVGVVSWGHGCARKNKPGLYAKVSKFTKWIETNKNLNS